jgi:hypothetical protein
MKKKAIYTVITGGYDTLKPAPHFKGWDTVAITDTFHDENEWDIVVQIPKSENPLLQSRYFKIMSHDLLRDYDLVCYIDGNQRLINPPPSVPTWFSHPRRNNIFDEAQAIINLKRFDDQTVLDQIVHYEQTGYKDRGLYMNGFFVREHNDEINELHNVWYQETTKYTHRDQLSLPYAIHKTGIYPTNIRPSQEKFKHAVIIKGH